MSDKTVVIRLVARADTRQIRGAGADVMGFAAEVSRGANKAGGAVKALGTASAIAGKLMVVGIGGAMAVSAKAAIDFESSLAGVAKTVDFTGSRFEGAASPINAFGEALRSLALRIPVSVNELAKIAEVGGQLGIDPNNLIEFTEVMAALGVSTNMSAEQAATGLARFSNIMGTSQKDFDVLGSIIVELGNNLATTESEILTFATRIASAGQVVGATEADILAISAALTSLGVPAERGGTAVQRVFIDMANAVANGGSKLEQFATVAGVTSEEFAQAWTDRPGMAFQMFIAGLDGITQSGGNVFQTLDNLNLNQVRTAQVLLAAAGGAELLAKSLDMASEEAKVNNALTEESGRRYATTESQIRLAGNAFNDLRIEIGNLMLGTGGIAFGIDALASFFRIIKENLDTIGSFVSLLMVVGGLKLAHVFATSAVEATKMVRGIKAGVTGLKAMGVAAGVLNIAILGLAGVAGIFLAVWADGAIKAAQFRQVTRQITADLEAGVGLVEAIIAAIEGKEFGGFFGMGGREVFDDETVRAIQDVFNMSPTQFLDALIQGRDLLGEMRGEVNKFDLAAGQATMFSHLVPELKEGRDAANEAGQAIDLIQKVIDGIRTARITEITSALMEAGFSAKMLPDRMRELAGILLDMNLGFTNQDIINLLTGDPDRHMRHHPIVDTLENTAKNIPKHWSTIVSNMEEGEAKLDGFYSAMEDSTTDFQDMMREAFEDVSDSIRAGFPAWDEYEQMTITSLDAVTAAQDRFLQDMVDWADARGSILGIASADTLAWLDSLDAPTRGAMARFAANNNAAWLGFINDTNGHFAELTGTTTKVWTQDMPAVVQQGLGMMFEIAVEETDKLGLVGTQYREALLEGMNLQLAATGFSGQLEDLIFSDHATRAALFKSLGFELGAQLIAGIVAGMGNSAGLGRDAFGSSVTNVNDKIKKELQKQWEVKSPSQWMIRFFRDDVMGGARIGVEQGIPQLSGLLSNLTNQIQPPPTPIVNVMGGGGGDTNRSITVNNPLTRSLREDLRLASVMVGSASEYGG